MIAYRFEASGPSYQRPLGLGTRLGLGMYNQPKPAAAYCTGGT